MVHRSTFFLGSCSPKGFCSQYTTLLEELDTLNIIKGGSGCGKSTFMRKIAEAAEARGLDVSYILCSSDPGSLDGIIIPSMSLGFVDGTAPHVLEPKLCGGSMNYINFGAFYDRAAMRPNEPEIRIAQAANAAQYPHVTACLAAADRLFDSVRAYTNTPACQEELAALAECLILSTLRPTGQDAKLHRRYLSAVTPEGLQFYGESAAQLCERVYVLRDDYQLAPALLSHILSKAIELGHDCYLCYTPLLPDSAPSHLLIPSAGIAFLSDCRDFPYSGESYCTIDLNSTLKPQTRQKLNFCLDTVSSLLKEAVGHIREAKQLHDRIEQLCHPYVDFDAVSRKTEEVLSELFPTE